MGQFRALMGQLSPTSGPLKILLRSLYKINNQFLLQYFRIIKTGARFKNKYSLDSLEQLQNNIFIAYQNLQPLHRPLLEAPSSVAMVVEAAVRAKILSPAMQEINKKYRMEHAAEVGFVVRENIPELREEVRDGVGRMGRGGGSGGGERIRTG